MSLYDDIKKLHVDLASEMNAKWDRSLPFQDLISDRWERAKSLGMGHATSIYESSYIYGNVKVGDNTWIGPFTLLDGVAGIKIGNYCSISAGVQIYSHDTVKWALSLGREKKKLAPVVIGDGVFIGPLSVIKAGISIGNQCVIGASTYVNKDIPSKSIAVGSPAKIIGQVELSSDGAIELKYF